LIYDSFREDLHIYLIFRNFVEQQMDFLLNLLFYKIKVNKIGFQLVPKDV